MISHQHKAIFIHVPKCAGSSVEHLLSGGRPKREDVDYEHLWGWCPKRRIHLQHATATQLLELELVTESQWRDYFKFAFVRNPFDRTCSDYFWMQSQTETPGGFWEYIERRSRFASILANPGHPSYRGDHLVPQRDFVCVDGQLAVDFIGRFENFERDLASILKRLQIDDVRVPHLKKGRRRHQHYSHFYSEPMRKKVTALYAEDLAAFDYRFDDRRNIMTNISRYVWPVRHTLGSWKHAAQMKFGT